MKNEALAKEWIKRAQSNLERARAERISEGILYEDLCFDCQQAVEKSLKALLVYTEVEFDWTHSITRLLNQIEAAGISVPEDIKESTVLAGYAVDTRYPGDYEPVSEEEYKQALNITERVSGWVEERMSEGDEDE